MDWPSFFQQTFIDVVIRWILPAVGAFAMPYFLKLKQVLNWPMAVFYGLITFAALLFITDHVADALNAMRSTQSVIYTFLKGTTYAIQDKTPPPNGRLFMIVARNPTGGEIYISSSVQDPELIIVETTYRFDQKTVGDMDEQRRSDLETSIIIELLRRNVEYSFPEKRLQSIHVQKHIPLSNNMDKEVFRGVLLEMESTARLITTIILKNSTMFQGVQR
ncbi:MAG: hypothetical protein A4E19_20365 [Nitrospira sp. SG-bin1]|nr:MAG: hypothetical protein A4E19_20365 [Nitrospira sp. SG-bin1]